MEISITVLMYGSNFVAFVLRELLCGGACWSRFNCIIFAVSCFLFLFLIL